MMRMTMVAVIGASLLALSLFWLRSYRTRVLLQASLDEACAGQESLQRVARLAARDLRDAALRLSGQVMVLSADPFRGAEVASSMAVVAERCRMLADDLGCAGQPLISATLHEERIDLLDCARDAVSSVAATLAPSRRHFRLPAAEFSAACVWADPRAVREVIGRVVTEAAFNTSNDDSISIFIEQEAGEPVLTVADEGPGLAGGDRSAVAPEHSSRGLGSTMALSRALMEAHGGRLDILATPNAGTRVSLVFPGARRRA